MCELGFTEIKVAGFIYKVTSPILELRENRLYGQINHIQLEIKIDSDLAADKVVSTVIHECLVHLPDTLYLSAEDQLKEGQVEQIGKGIFQILKDNPDLVEYLYKHFKGEKNESESNSIHQSN